MKESKTRMHVISMFVCFNIESRYIIRMGGKIVRIKMRS